MVQINSRNRRRVGLVAIPLLLIILLSGCTEQQKEENGKVEVIYGEAPALAELVEAGILPPVEERLPKNPIIIQPIERVGVYGGDWKMGLLSKWDESTFTRTIYYENLVKWSPEWTRIVPNVAQSYEINEDSTEFIFHLREGMRWSDGEPFTSRDILFSFETLSNEELINASWTRTFSPWLTSGGERVSVEIPDNKTVVFKFKEPYGMFLQTLATPTGNVLTSRPYHFLKEYFIEYSPNVNETAIQEGWNSWIEFFYSKVASYYDILCPSINAWQFENDYYHSASEIIVTRNPYYWKVDTDLNQLPYIDRIVFTVVDTREEMVDLVLAGKINMQYRHIATKSNKPFFDSNQEQGNYGYFSTISSHSNTGAIHINQNTNDTVKKMLFQDKNFRIGLSLAINRNEIISSIYDNECIPYQVAPLPSSVHYNERLATQYLDYNISLANDYLDKTGYSETDSEGYRIFHDGRRIALNIYYADIFGYDWSIMIAMLENYWEDVGVEIIPHALDRSTFEEIRTHPDYYYDAMLWEGGGGLDFEFVLGQWVPIDHSAIFAPEWVEWYISNGSPDFEEPPEDIQQLYSLYHNFNANANSSEQKNILADLSRIVADRFDIIGISTVPDSYGIISNDFKNVPRLIPDSWIYPSPAPTDPCQYYVKASNNSAADSNKQTAFFFIQLRLTNPFLPSERYMFCLHPFVPIILPTSVKKVSHLY